MDNAKYYGSLSDEHPQGANPLMAFTLGEDMPWISYGAKNLIDLLDRVRHKIKRSRMLYLQINHHGTYVKNFNLYAGRKEKKLNLYIHADNAITPQATLFFSDFRVEKILPIGSDETTDGVAFQIATLKLTDPTVSILRSR